MHYSRRLVVTSAVGLLALGMVAEVAVGPINPDQYGQAYQASSSRGLDHADVTHWGWDNTIPGVAGRPYIKRLAISNNGGAFEDVVVPDSANGSNGWAPLRASIGGQLSDVYAFITPTNGCRSGQAPGIGSCYDPPNRVGISLMKHLGNADYDENFTDNPSANPPVTDSSVIDLTIGFHRAYSTLRWSWVNGVPSYWTSTVSPLADGEVRIKFTPRTVPVMNSGGCSQIPVSTCDITQADHEYLEPGMILSMDNTLDPALSGVLFGTSSAFIGSLEAQVPSGQSPVLTYGVAAPHNTAGGTPRAGTFFAFLPSPVLSLFGTSANAFDSSIFSVARSGDPGTFSPSWTQWNAGANGTDGQLLTISNISFSAPKFVVSRHGANGGANTGGGTSSGGSFSSGSTAPKTMSIRVGKTASFKQIARMLTLSTAGGKVSAKVSTAKVCKVSRSAIKGLKPGSCKGSLTVKRTKGATAKKGFAITVTR